jgi:hypothetical protein
MALTSETKHRIVFALCHNAKILDPGSTHFNSIFNDRLEGLNPFVEERIEILLGQIEAQKNKVAEASAKGNVKRIGDIELDSSRTIELANKELRRLQSELAEMLDIPNACKGARSTARVCW